MQLRSNVGPDLYQCTRNTVPGVGRGSKKIQPLSITFKKPIGFVEDMESTCENVERQGHRLMRHISNPILSRSPQCGVNRQHTVHATQLGFMCGILNIHRGKQQGNDNNSLVRLNQLGWYSKKHAFSSPYETLH